MKRPGNSNIVPIQTLCLYLGLRSASGTGSKRRRVVCAAQKKRVDERFGIEKIELDRLHVHSWPSKAIEGAVPRS